MKKISTKLVIINIMIFMILSMISFSNVSKADSSSDLYLNKVEYNVKVNDDGSMNVEEKWNMQEKY